MMSEILFSVDLENHTGDPCRDGRVIRNTRKILALLERKNVSGTFFAVASFARRNPAFVREVSDLGHEIACHSLDHLPLDKEGRKAAERSIPEAKSILENVAGAPVKGYRAPLFSLNAETRWITEVLAENGFFYSSSVIPKAHALYGFAGTSEKIFRWESGLWEIPVSLGKIGGIRMPYLGGIYLRYFPLAVIRGLIAKTEAGLPLWSYVHPYDVDADEGFFRFPNVGPLSSFLLWVNRKNTLKKLERIDYRSETFLEYLGRIVEK